MDYNGHEPILALKDLSIAFKTELGTFDAVKGLSFAIEAGKTLAIVGESGCGKSVSASAMMGLLPENGLISSGSIHFAGKNLANLSEREFEAYRGSEIAMIFQEPMTALNPVYTIGQQIIEVFRIHQGLGKKAARAKSCEMLEKVQIPAPSQRMDEYPFQMSGGMRQRVLIAMALACRPRLLIADEPTTALDVTVQAQIISLIRDLQRDMNMAILFITHDLSVVAEVADEVLVMYGGLKIEHADVFSLFANPSHPYTKGLLASIPKASDHKGIALDSISGIVPPIHKKIEGCRFRNRCSSEFTPCHSISPKIRSIKEGHSLACHLGDQSYD